jgi:hypothetical protein
MTSFSYWSLFGQEINARFEVFTAVTMKNAVYGMLCCVALVRTDVLEKRYHTYHQGDKNQRPGTLQVTSNQRTLQRLLVTANVPSSLIPVTLMMEVIRSSETLILTRATWSNIPEDSILHENK